MVEFTWPSDAIKQSARQVGIPSYAGGRRRAKPLLQYSKKHWMKELGDGCWHASPKPPVAQRAGGIRRNVFLEKHVFGRGVAAGFFSEKFEIKNCVF